jgi:hypothetical protein
MDIPTFIPDSTFWGSRRTPSRGQPSNPLNSKGLEAHFLMWEGNLNEYSLSIICREGQALLGAHLWETERRLQVCQPDKTCVPWARVNVTGCDAHGKSVVVRMLAGFEERNQLLDSTLMRGARFQSRWIAGTPSSFLIYILEG